MKTRSFLAAAAAVALSVIVPASAWAGQTVHQLNIIWWGGR